MVFSVLLLLLIVVALASSGILGWRKLYYDVLTRDIADWRARGWVTPEQAAYLRKQTKPKRPRRRFIFFVALLGVLLLLISLFTFMAANWHDISRPARLSWMIFALIGAYLLGWRLRLHGYKFYSEAAWLTGIGLFGLNILLLSKMYHIERDPSAIVLVWTIGAFVTAIFLNSRAALLVTFAGALLWTALENLAYGVPVHWAFLALWVLATMLGIGWQWRPASHAALLTGLIWLVLSILQQAMLIQWAPPGIAAMLATLFLLLFAIALVLRGTEKRFDLFGVEQWLERYAIFGLLASLFFLQTVRPQHPATNLQTTETWLQGPTGWLPVALALTLAAVLVLIMVWREGVLRGSDVLALTGMVAFGLGYAFLAGSPPITWEDFDGLSLWIYGAIYLALLVWFLSYVQRHQDDLYVWGTLILFIVEVFYVYGRVFGPQLETPVFFLIGGGLMLLVAFVLNQLQTRLQVEEASA